MTFNEFCIVSGACCGLAVVRFGVPVAVMWLAHKVADLAHVL